MPPLRRDGLNPLCHQLGIEGLQKVISGSCLQGALLDNRIIRVGHDQETGLGDARLFCLADHPDGIQPREKEIQHHRIRSFCLDPFQQLPAVFFHLDHVHLVGTQGGGAGHAEKVAGVCQKYLDCLVHAVALQK